jgi:hypothetical protein
MLPLVLSLLETTAAPDAAPEPAAASWDVVVYGSSPAGIAAATAAGVVLARPARGRLRAARHDRRYSREISTNFQAKLENFENSRISLKIFCEISREYTGATRPLPLVANVNTSGTEFFPLPP